MSWINNYAQVTIMCDECKEAQESIERDDVPEKRWNEGAAMTLSERCVANGWSIARGRHRCPACLAA